MISLALPPTIPTESGEVWLRLPTGPDDEFWWAAPIYYVSTLGRVYWYAPAAQPHQREGLKALREHRKPGKRPHLVTNLHVAEGGKTYRRVYVHRLVLATHAGPDSYLTPLGCHGPGGSLDNQLVNLAWGSHSANLKDQYAYGERGRGASGSSTSDGASDEEVAATEREACSPSDDYAPDPVLGF